MTTVKPIDKLNTWQQINWKKVERQVFALQTRIYRASLSGNVKMVHSLQRLLTKSYYGKLLATRRVTQDNQGKVTAGVDGKKSLNPEQRIELVKNLNLSKKTKPLRRVFILKSDKTKRGLGIPTIEDRAKQALVKLGLEPQWESIFEENSYGFRPARSCHDAIEAIIKSISRKPKYVLDADIAGCFDNINHQKLLEKLNSYPQFRKQIKMWLKCGVLKEGVLTPTNKGTPQGGVISPLLANIALHGMELEIKEYAKSIYCYGVSKKNRKKAISVIRYADDFVILHDKLEVIIECKNIIKNWLGNIGLELNPSKTLITHTLNEYEGNIGFNFLGFNIRQYPVGKSRSAKSRYGKTLGFKTLIKPSKEKVKSHMRKIGETIRSHKTAPQEALIKALNPIIRGWCNYYSTVCSKETFGKCDNILYHQLKRWGERRHPKKSKLWVVNKYYHSDYTNGKLNNWCFSTNKGVKLLSHFEKPIVRHIKVKGDKSLFDGDMLYWSTRLGKHPEVSTRMATLLKRQKGKCNHCGLYFKDGDLVEIDHVIPRISGGKDEYSNLQALHRHCHDIKTMTDGSLNGGKKK